MIRTFSILLLVTALVVGVLGFNFSIADAASASADERIITATTTTRLHNPSDQISRVELTVPLWSDESSTYHRLISESLSPEPTEIRRDGTARTAVFHLEVEPGTAVEIVERYVVAVRSFDSSTTQMHVLNEAQRALYLTSEPHIEADNPQLIKSAGQITESASTDTQKAQAIFDFVRGHLTYSLESPAKNQGALAGFKSGSGVCTEFASLFVALARSAGVPSRVVNGIVLLDNRGRLANAGFTKKVRHQWAEYFDPRIGWVPVDPTLAASMDESIGHPAYVRQNFGDRPIQGTSRGGSIRASKDTRLTELHNLQQ